MRIKHIIVSILSLLTTPSIADNIKNHHFEKAMSYIKNSNYDSAFQPMLKAANENYIDAQNWMGIFYKSGLGCLENKQESEAWFKKAYKARVKKARKGDIDAQYNLGIMYLSGHGVSKNNKTSEKWLKKASEKNHLGALFVLGGVYEYTDTKKAFELIFQSAEQGYKIAYHSLGSYYYFGKGTSKDFMKALYWYEKDAQLGSSVSQYLIGKMYLNGEGVEKDKEKAIEWLNTAKENGSDQASFLLLRANKT